MRVDHRGTGSLGNELTRILLDECGVKRLVIFSRDEMKHHLMSQKFRDTRLRFFIGDVRDKVRMLRAFEGVDYVIHTAAMKHIGIAEYNPLEAIKTNILGGENVIEAALDCKIRKVIAISTDAAVNPINLYGATKLCADKPYIGKILSDSDMVSSCRTNSSPFPIQFDKN